MRPPQDAIDTFVSITGASEAVAVSTLQEHGGDLNEAVNAHFIEGDRSITSQHALPVHHADDDSMDIDNPHESLRGASLLSARGLHEYLNPFSALPAIQRALGVGPGTSSHAPRVSHPTVRREIPVEVKNSNSVEGYSEQGPRVVEVNDDESVYGPGIYGTVTIDDEATEDLSSIHAGVDVNTYPNVPFRESSEPSAPPAVFMDDDVEEQMIRAAIEASKRETREHGKLIMPELDRRPPPSEDVDLARAVSLSLESAEQERALREQSVHLGLSSDLPDTGRRETNYGTNRRQGLVSGKVGTSQQQDEGDNKDAQKENEDLDNQPLVRRRPRRLSSQDAILTDSIGTDSTSSGQTHYSTRNGFHSEEWGGISSEEHHEAVMLEAAMFGGIPVETSHQFTYPLPFTSIKHRRETSPPSPALTEQRLLREQQDDEYLVALQADREKDLKALHDAEQQRVEEEAAREENLKRQKFEDEENNKKLLEEEELESVIAAKKASLPEEPLSDDVNAVTLVVRMPDGSRHGRRFLKSDKLMLLHDFLVSGRIVRPGTYRLVRPYPRRAFTDAERELSLGDLGLTSKLEALFLELI